ncbi:MAG: FMN-binding protein [Oscillospiraceae bacterium]|nr:FMN-binding protein [Oscillospiraceae bacterium]
MTRKTLIKSIVVLAVICLVISGALAVVNSFTSPLIEAGKVERETASRQLVLPEAVDFELLENDAMPASVTGAYKGVNAAGETVGYVFTAGNKGFDGTIVVMTAIDNEGKIVRVATIDVTSETSTLGGQTAKEFYTEQYTGKDGSLSGVDAISGATITSKAYELCVKDSFAAYDIVKEG